MIGEELPPPKPDKRTLDNPQLNPQARKIIEAITDPEEAKLITQITIQLNKTTSQPQEQIAQALTKYITKYPQTHKIILKKLLQQAKQNPHQTLKTIKQTKPPTPPNPKQTIKQVAKTKLKIWDSGDLGDSVSSVSWSPSGDRIAVRLSDRVVVYSSSGKLLWLGKLGGSVSSVSWSPSGDKIAVGVGIRVFVYSSIGQKLWEKDLGGWVWSVSWSPDGEKLAVGGDFKKVIVYSSIGQKLWEKDLAGSVESISWSPGGDRIAVGIGWSEKIGDEYYHHGRVFVFFVGGLGGVFGSVCSVSTGVGGLVGEGLRCACEGDWGCFAGVLDVWSEVPLVPGGGYLAYVAALTAPVELERLLWEIDRWSSVFGVLVDVDGFLDGLVDLLVSCGGGRSLDEVGGEVRGRLKRYLEVFDRLSGLGDDERGVVKEFVAAAVGGLEGSLGVDDFLGLVEAGLKFLDNRSKGVEGLNPSVEFVGEGRVGEFSRVVLRVCFGVRVPGVVRIVSSEVSGGGEVRAPREGFRVDYGSGCVDIPVYVLARSRGEVPVEVKLAFEGPGGFGGEFTRTVSLRVSELAGSSSSVGEAVPMGVVGGGGGSSGFPDVLRELFEPLEFLGEGGFGRVWRVRRVSDGSVSAVKIPRLSDPELGRVFLREVSVWLRLKHRNIVELRDANVVPVPYLEMEYVPGARLNGRLVRCLEDLPKPVDPELAVRVFEGIAAGVAYAHSMGVVHRDLKPLNVLLDEGLVPKITDWGLAKLSAITSSRMGLKAYSPAYAAPEQVDEESYGGTDERTDIYQLGLILYELLTGKLPYEATTPAALVAKIVRGDIPPDPPSKHRSDLKPFDAPLMRALAKKKEHRYPSVKDFVRDVKTALRKYLGATGESLEEVRREVEEVKKTMRKSIRRGAGKKEVRALKARYAELLGKYAVAALVEGEVEEAIGGLEELLYYTSRHEEELATVIKEAELMAREGVIGEELIKRVKLVVAKIAAEVRGGE